MADDLAAAARAPAAWSAVPGSRPVQRLAMVLVAALAALLVFSLVRALVERNFAARLQIEVEQLNRQLIAYSLQGNLMGSVSLLGVIHANIKQEALGGIDPKESMNSVVLGLVGGTYRARGVFVVGEDGLVKSSWNQDGSSSTGTDVRQRPYYQAAVRGKASVYAAVSMAARERSIYFAAPVFSEMAIGNSGIGAVVARNDLVAIEQMLKDAGARDALLVSPQGVVFAASEPHWVGRIAGPVTPQRLRDIQQRKQVSALVDPQALRELPFVLESGVQVAEGQRQVMAVSDLDWNDPGGAWKLVMVDSVDTGSPGSAPVLSATLTLLLSLALQALVARALRSRRAQRDAAQALEANLAQQQQLITLRHAMSRMALQLQQSTTAQELGQNFLAEMHRATGMLQGVLYAQPLAPEPGQADRPRFGVTARFATPAGAPDTLQAGEGLLGQTLLSGELRWLGQDQASQWRVTSGLGATEATCVALCPLTFNDALLGAVELVFIRARDPVRDGLVEEAVAVLALNVAVQQRSAAAAAPDMKASKP